MSMDRIGQKLNVRMPAEFPGGPRRPDDVSKSGASFGNVLEKSIRDVSDMQVEAADRVDAFVRGENVPLHDVVLAQEEAEISFRLLLQVRNNLVQAYQEIMRTPM